MLGFVEAMTARSYAATWQAEKPSHGFIIMPEMDACTLMSNLRNQCLDLRVLAVSDYLAAEDLKGYGFDGFIEKPVGLYQLQNMVEMTLQK